MAKACFYTNVARSDTGIILLNHTEGCFMKETLPKSIDNYKIIETIHNAPDGILYKAADETSGSRVLIKTYFPLLKWSDDVLKEFFDRMDHLRFVEHDYLLPILDVGKHENRPYIVYPLDSFSFLGGYASRKISQKEGVELFSKIAESLDFLHKQEIIHGSLNVENILVDSERNPKVFDYGLTEVFRKLLMDNMEDGFSNLSVSDVRCTSPEQILGKSLNRSSDIYAFGMILYFSVFGKFLFDGSSAPEVAVGHISEGVVYPEAPDSRNVSKAMIRFIQKCIQVNPEDRFENFVEVQQVLGRIMKGWPIHIPHKKRFVFVPPRKIKNRQPNLLLGLVLFFATFFLWYFFKDGLTGRADDIQAPATVIVNQQPLQTTVVTTQLPSVDVPSVEAQPSQGSDTIIQPLTTSAIFKPAFGNETPRQPTEKITIFNVGQIDEYLRLGYGKPEDVDISSDPNVFALATSAGVFIYNQNQLSTWVDTRGWATSVEFSPDDSTLAIGLDSGEIQLWDWQNDAKVATLTGHSAKVSRILFSNNGLFLYSASADQRIKVWNLNSQGIIHDIVAHSNPVNDIAVSSDGRILVSCSDDQLIRFWDVASGTKLFELKVSGKVEAVAFSPDDIYFAAGGETGYIRQWDVKTLKLRTDPIPVKSRVWSLEYIAEGSRLLAGIDNGEFMTYSATQLSYDGISLNFEINPMPSSLKKIFGTDFKFDSYTASDGSGNGQVSIRWDGKVSRQGTEILGAVYDNLDRLDISSDGMVLAASGPRGITSVWQIVKNRMLYQGAVRLPNGDPIAPDSSSIIVETPANYLSVRLDNAAPLNTYSGLISDGVVSFADEGSILVSGSANQSRVWDYSSSLETFYIAYSTNGCRFTLSDNNGEFLQVSSAVGVFQTLDEEVKTICAKSSQYRNSLPAIAANNKLMIYRGTNGLIEGIDPVLNQLLWTYKPENVVTVMSVSPDGSFAVLGTGAGVLLFIDGRTGESIAEIEGNFGAVQAIEFSEDGTKIATVGSDGVARLFGIVESSQ